MTKVVAVDLGATSGRVISATYDGHTLHMQEENRFFHQPVALPAYGRPQGAKRSQSNGRQQGEHGSGQDVHDSTPGTVLAIDFLSIWNGILQGLRTAGSVDSIGVDTWGVDYGYIDSHGHLVGIPLSYRSDRTNGLIEYVDTHYTGRLYENNGIQVQPFNTLYQFIDDALSKRPVGTHIALLPDLINFLLSGRRVAEITNMSTTGLIDPRTRSWSEPICDFIDSIRERSCIDSSGEQACIDSRHEQEFINSRGECSQKAHDHSDGEQLDISIRSAFGSLVEPGQIIGRCRLALYGSAVESEDSSVAQGEDASVTQGDNSEATGRVMSATSRSQQAYPRVIAVGSHDTASAVAAVPAHNDAFAYISCGTWSLVGVELDGPVMTQQAHEANFTNELGVHGTVRFLKNIMGMWVQAQCFEQWKNMGMPIPRSADEWAELDRQTAEIASCRHLIDLSDPIFFAPHSETSPMTERIDSVCARHGYPIPETPAQYMRCLYDSLAIAYRHAIAQACELSGKQIDTIHIVGGGAQNALLCQSTADATGLPVYAGPVEATSIGNIALQLQALGDIDDGISAIRQLVRDNVKPRLYTPRKEYTAQWDKASAQISA